MRSKWVIGPETLWIQVVMTYADRIPIVSQASASRPVNLVLVFEAGYGLRQRPVALWSRKRVVEWIWACWFWLTWWLPRVRRLASPWCLSICGWCALAICAALLGSLLV
jgi:hypothetical protein